MLRLHISPSSVGDVRDLLAVTLSARILEGQTVTAQASMLRLPAVDQAGFDAAPADEYVASRLQELEFGTASQALRELARRGDARGVQAMLDELERRFGQHPWLKDKLARLRILAQQDAEMMSKEVMFSQRKMSSRLNARHEVSYSMDETHSAMPSFLRKKAEEGKGRQQK
jgi:hypothetical protein